MTEGGRRGMPGLNCSAALGRKLRFIRRPLFRSEGRSRGIRVAKLEHVGPEVGEGGERTILANIENR